MKTYHSSLSFSSQCSRYKLPSTQTSPNLLGLHAVLGNTISNLFPFNDTLRIHTVSSSCRCTLLLNLVLWANLAKQTKYRMFTSVTKIHFTETNNWIYSKILISYSHFCHSCWIINTKAGSLFNNIVNKLEADHKAVASLNCFSTKSWILNKRETLSYSSKVKGLTCSLLLCLCHTTFPATPLLYTVNMCLQGVG